MEHLGKVILAGKILSIVGMFQVSWDFWLDNHLVHGKYSPSSSYIAITVSGALKMIFILGPGILSS